MNNEDMLKVLEMLNNVKPQEPVCLMSELEHKYHIKLLEQGRHPYGDSFIPFKSMCGYRIIINPSIPKGVGKNVNYKTVGDAKQKYFRH